MKNKLYNRGEAISMQARISLWGPTDEQMDRGTDQRIKRVIQALTCAQKSEELLKSLSRKNTAIASARMAEWLVCLLMRSLT
jgi:hypothetical protein